jgi:hypothetical protein
MNCKEAREGVYKNITMLTPEALQAHIACVSMGSMTSSTAEGLFLFLGVQRI